MLAERHVGHIVRALGAGQFAQKVLPVSNLTLNLDNPDQFVGATLEHKRFNVTLISVNPRLSV